MESKSQKRRKAIQKKGKAPKRERHYGIVKPRKGGKMCWTSVENKHGWSLGLHVNGRHVWLKHTRFSSEAEVKAALQNGIVFIHKKEK